MWRLKILASACLAGTLSACAVVDPVDSRYDTIGRSLAKARDESIFLNLVRASHDDPLSFVTISNVTPSLSNTSSFALPSFLLGPSPRNVEPSFSPGRDVSLGSSTAANSTAISTNFNVSTQETSSFYTGFLKPIDLQTLDYFIRQGYSHELLFWLFTQSVEITGPTPVQRLLSYDPPDDYGCLENDPNSPCFREFVLLALISGLTVEQRIIISTQASKQSTPALGNTQNQLAASKPPTISYFRFCFDHFLAEKGERDMGRDLANEIKARYLILDISKFRPLCGSKWDPGTQPKVQPDTLEFNADKVRYRIRPRSAFGIFKFLGALIKIQTASETVVQNEQSGRAAFHIPPTLETAHDDPDLFRVSYPSEQDCFVHTNFKGAEYCVPDNALNTKRILNLLAQLIAIETAATDLSITPTVRVIQ
jgi:hypothetical protein